MSLVATSRGKGVVQIDMDLTNSVCSFNEISLYSLSYVPWYSGYSWAEYLPCKDQNNW